MQQLFSIFIQNVYIQLALAGLVSKVLDTDLNLLNLVGIPPSD